MTMFERNPEVGDLILFSDNAFGVIFEVDQSNRLFKACPPEIITEYSCAWRNYTFNWKYEDFCWKWKGILKR